MRRQTNYKVHYLDIFFSCSGKKYFVIFTRFGEIFHVAAVSVNLKLLVSKYFLLKWILHK